MRDWHRRVGCVSRWAGLCLGLAAFTLAPPVRAQTSGITNFLGLYIGAGVGQSHIRNSFETLTDVHGFVQGHTAWRAFVGIRPIPFLGAEAAYVDFGNPSVSTSGLPGVSYTAQQSLREGALFGLLYLPLPIPLVDVYGKAGYSRLRTSTNVAFTCATFPCPSSFNQSGNNNRFAYGAGVQVHVWRFGVRADYERINVPGSSSPDLWSLNVLYNF